MIRVGQMLLASALKRHLRIAGGAIRPLSGAFASLQVASRDAVEIHPWHQLLHSVRTEVTSLHHNVAAVLAEQFGTSWRPSVASEPVWLLGRCYMAEDAPIDSVHPHRCSSVDALLEDTGSPAEFDQAWGQISRMTYRRGFAPMYRCVRDASSESNQRAQYIKLTSDAGWGCMIRVGQMLLASALKRHLRIAGGAIRPLSGAFARADTDLEKDCMNSPLERQFMDDPSHTRSPFSIFAFIRAAYGNEITDPGLAFLNAGSARGAVVRGPKRMLTEKKPGDWFGPTTVSETIAALVDQHPDLRSTLAVYVDSDGMLYEDEVRALGLGRADPSAADLGSDVVAASAATTDVAAGGPASPCLDDFEMIGEEAEVGEDAHGKSWCDSASGDIHSTPWVRSVLLLFPLQLGVEKHVCSAHVPGILRYFELPASLGAMGGRPRMAHFFVGRHTSGLLYVDPHVVQPAAVYGSDEDYDQDTFRNVPTVQVIPVEQIDSSLSVAFFCQCEQDLRELARGLRQIEVANSSAAIRAECTRPLSLRLLQSAWHTVPPTAIAEASQSGEATWEEGVETVEVEAADSYDGEWGTQDAEADDQTASFRGDADRALHPVVVVAAEAHPSFLPQQLVNSEAFNSEAGSDAKAAHLARSISVGQPWSMFEA
jgi:hypothetical protein